MDPVYEEARKRVKAKKDFFKELASYVPTALMLMFINIFTSPGYYWFLWAIVPWGITLLFKGIQLIIADKTRGWERTELRKEIRSLGRDPDEYVEEPLDLEDFKEIEKEELFRDGDYRKSDFV